MSPNPIPLSPAPAQVSVEIRIQMWTAIVKISLLTVLSLQLCGCRASNVRKRVVSVLVRVIAVLNRASTVQIPSSPCIAAYLANFTS